MKRLLFFILLAITLQAKAYDVIKLNPIYAPNPSRGRPISLGTIYIGEPDTDPTVVGNQKTIYVLEEDSSITQVAQPLTMGAGGVPLYNGDPVTIMTNGDYSLAILNSSGSQVYYVPSDQSINEKFPTVATLAALKALSIPGTDGYKVYLLGRTTTNDGGQGVFIWDSSDLSVSVTADTQAGVYVPPNSDNTGASGAWVRVINGLYHPEWFGAIVDDAVSDLTAIQAAYDLGNRVQLSAGTYDIDGEIVLDTTGFTFQGAGVGLTIIDHNAAANYAISVNGQDIDDWEMGGFTVIGSGATTDGAIEIYGPDDYLMHDIQLLDWQGAYGLHIKGSLSKGSYGGRYRNISVLVADDTYSSTIGVFIDGVANLAADPSATGTARANAHVFEGLSVLYTSTHNIKIKGAKAITFSGPWLEDCDYSATACYGIYLDGGSFNFSDGAKNVPVQGITSIGGHTEGLTAKWYSDDNTYVRGIQDYGGNNTYTSTIQPLTAGSWGGGQNYFCAFTQAGATYSIRSATYRWLLSAAGTTEYYLDLAAGGDPALREPDDVIEDLAFMTAGTVGSLAASEWDYGDNDALGYNTIYVRLSDGSDPDSQAADYLLAMRGGLTSKIDKIGGLGDKFLYIGMDGSGVLTLSDSHPLVGDEDFFTYDRNTSSPFIKMTANYVHINGATRFNNYDATFADADTTPSVANGSFFKGHTGGGSVDVTAFDGGVGGQCIKIYTPNALTVFKHQGGAGVNTCTLADVTSATGQIYEFCNIGNNEWRPNCSVE